MKTIKEMKELLTAKSVSFPARANVDALAQLCRENGIDVDNNTGTDTESESESDTDMDTTTTAVAIVVLGSLISDATVCERDSEIVRKYIAEKRSREFPDYIGSLPDAQYEITNSVMPVTWVDGDGETRTFMLIIVKNLTDGKLYGIATWDLCSRMRIHSATTGKDYAHDSVSKVAWTTSSSRDTAALAIPAGTKFFVTSVYGWWVNPAKQPKKAYTFKVATESEFVDK